MFCIFCLKDRNYYMFKLFKDYWLMCMIECQICFEKIDDNGGIVVMFDIGMLNLEKMFYE